MTALEARLPEDSGAGAQLEQLVQLARRIDDDLHRIALELRPTALDDLGLHAALLNFAEEWGERAKVEVDYSSHGLEHRRLPPAVETAVFRIVQEAFTNVGKHAAAGRVGLILKLRGDDLVVIDEDDGVGFDPEQVVAAAQAAGRLGMRGMRERAALVGGDLEVESTPGGGTTVFVRIPLRPDARAMIDD
jgi:signal transduction histidine kinase